MKKILRSFVMMALLAVPFVTQAQVTCDNGTLTTVANAEVSTANSSYIPGYSYYNYSYSEVIIPAGSIELASYEVKALQFKPASTSAGTYFTNCDVYLCNTTQENLSAGFVQDLTNFTLVYTGDLNYTTTDWQTVVFTNSFQWDGSSNILVAVHRKHGGWTSGSSFQAYSADAQLARYVYQDSGPYTIGSITGGTATSTVALYHLVGCATNPTCMRVRDVEASNITTDGLTLTWLDTANSGATYTIYDMSDSSVVATNVSATTYTISGLNANTAYTFGVEVNCSATDNSSIATVTTRTACGINTVPYSTGIEGIADGALPYCWDTLAGGHTSSHLFPTAYAYASNAHTGSVYFEFETNYGETEIAVLPEFDTPISGLQLNFWACATNTANFVFEVGVVESGLFVVYDTVAITQSSSFSSSNYHYYQVFFNEYTGSGNRIALRVTPAGTATSYTFFMDDIEVTEFGGCFPIENLAVSNIGSSSVTLTWHDASNSGATYTVYDMADTSVVESAISDTTVTLTTLTPNTQYTLAVVADCSSLGESDAVTASFRTNCAPMPIPFTETFDATLSNDPCWRGNSSTLANDVFGGSTLALNANNAWTYSSSTSNGLDAGHYRVNIYGSSCKKWMITPEIDLSTAATAQLSFDVAFTAYSGTGVASGFENNASQAFIVAFSTDGGQTWDSASAVRWQNAGGQHTLAEIASTSYLTQVIDLTQFLGDTIRIAFYCQSTTSGGDNNLHLDNIVVSEVPSCPNVYGIVLDSLTASEAFISWPDNGADSYDVEVRQDTTVVSYATVVVTDTTAEISNLLIDNDYQVYVRSNCGSDVSDWSSPFNIHIGYCVPNPTSVDGSGLAGVSFGGMTNTTHPTSAAYANYASMVGNVSAGTDVDVEITYATGYTYGTIIWVDWNNNMAFEGTEVVYAGTSGASNPTTLTATFTVPATQDTGLYRMRILGADSYFDSYVGSIAAAAAANPCASFSWGVAEDYSLYVGEAPSCMAITNLAVDSATATSVMLSWADTLNGSASYTVYNMADTSVVATNVNTTSYEVTGLTASTSYTFGVVANCSATDESSIVTVNALTDCAGGSCTVSIYAEDGYGDGWDGSYISVVQNGATVATFTMADQSLFNTPIYDTFTVSVCSGLPVSFIWNNIGGEYDDEASFAILNGSNTVITSVADASDLTSGAVFFTVNDACAAAPVLDSFVVVLGVNDATMGTTVPAPGTYTFFEGDTATAQAVANAGYHFVRWEQVIGTFVDTTVANPASHVIDSTMLGLNMTMTAIFEADSTPVVLDSFTVVLGVNDTAMGTITPAPGTYVFQLGDTATATAVANPGYHFVMWLQQVGSFTDTTIANPASHVIDSTLLGLTMTMTAIFEADAVVTSDSVMVGAVCLAHGSASVANTTNNVGVYYVGDTVTITATPDSGYVFTDWVVTYTDAAMNFTTDTLTVNPYTMVIDSTLASYSVIIFTAEVEAISGELDSMTVILATADATMGTTNPAPGQYRIPENDTLFFSAVANTGYHFLYWISEFQLYPGDSTISVDTIYADTVSVVAEYWVLQSTSTYTAYFEADTTGPNPTMYTVTVSANNSSLGTVEGAGVYAEGSTVTLTATPSEGCSFVGWLIDGDTIADNPYTFTITSHVTAMAIFAAGSTGIEDADMANVSVYGAESRIVVRGAEGKDVFVYDLNGRTVASQKNATENTEFRMANTGVYLVKVGNAQAKRVLVVR